MARDRGSASIEAVGAIMSLALFACVILQLLLVMDGYLVAGHATREGARAYAAGASETQVRFLVATVAGIHPNDADITITPRFPAAGELVTVRLQTQVQKLPVLEAILPDLPIDSDATSRAEVEQTT